MRVSVILTTFNSPDWLQKVILGYAAQTHRGLELIVADDGSTGETAAMLQYCRNATGLAIRHVWHEDRGFRKCVILNRSIEQAETDYLVFSDGDCIPRRDFVAQHVRLARPGRFLSGGTVRLPLPLSRRLDHDDIASGRCFRSRWLLAHGMRSLRGLKKLHLVALAGPAAAWADALATTRATWNGHNASAWRADLLGVNGFDERMQYGGLDRELGERLVNAGVQPVQVRHRAVCVHLDHPRPYVSGESWQRNHEIRRQTRLAGRTWTEFGIRRQGPQRLLIAEREVFAVPRFSGSSRLRRAA